MRILGLLCGLTILAVSVFPAGVQSPSAVIGPCWVTAVKDGDSISVRLPDGPNLDVRYMAVSAPELKDELGPQAKDRNEVLVDGSHVWLEVEVVDGGYRWVDRGRVLAYVFLDEARSRLVQEMLISEGLATVYLPGIIDRELVPGAFPIRYADQLLAAQVEAARERRGLWQLPDFYPERDVVVAAVKFWGDVEVVYIVNRGLVAIDFGQRWVLMDKDAYEKWQKGERPLNRLEFSALLGPSCQLLPGKVLLVRNGSGIPEKDRNRVQGCGISDVVLNWFGRTVWDNDGDEVFLYGPDETLWSGFRYPWKSDAP